MESNKNSELRSLNLQSLIHATKSDAVSCDGSGASSEIVDQIPAWDCNQGVCTLQWKPRREKETI